MTEAELRELQEQYLAFKARVEDMWKMIAETLGLAFDGIKRTVLYHVLPRWIPGTIRHWLAWHWPRVLLPKFSRVIEWIETEATE